MANLTESALWAGVYRLERTDPVIGQDPLVPATIGKSNQAAQDLANRDLFLRTQLDQSGMGLNALTAINNLDTLQFSGTYYASSGATGAPVAATVFTVLHQAGNATTTASQTAISLAGDRSFRRRKVANVWQAWTEMWGGLEAISSLTANGYQRLPSGLILQWISAVVPGGAALVTVTNPIAFPNNSFGAFVTRHANNPQADDIYASELFLATTTIRRLSTAVGSNTTKIFMIGN